MNEPNEPDACLHDETERLGAIWTRCTQCGQRWADDDPKSPFRTHGVKGTPE